MKRGFLAMVMMMTIVAGYSQSTSLGINGGIGHAWLSNYPGTRFKTGGNLGLSLIHSTKSSFGFGVDLKYSIEGGKSVVGNVTRTTSLDYLRIPVKAMYFFGVPGQRIRPKVSIGPSFGFLIGGETTVETTPGATNVFRARDIYENFDIGLNASAGFNYRLVQRTWLVVDLNYYKGFRDIQAPLVGSNTYSNLTNNSIGINVGVNWGIGSTK